MVDALLYLRPDVETVQARWGTLGHSSEVCEVEDTAAALLTFSDGALGLIQCTTCSYPDHGERLEVHAMGGTAVLTDTGLVSWEMAEAGFAASAADLAERDEAFTGHRSLYEEVVPYFRGQAECRCDLASGRRAVALIEAIYESARADGAPVRPTLDG